MKWLHHEWQGIVAVILSVAVGIALITAELGRHLSDPEAQLVNTILGAIVGALATYLGSRINGNGNGKSDT